MHPELKKAPIKVACGSLRLDMGEGEEYALSSIQKVSTQLPTFYSYDIICKKAQMVKAQILSSRLAKRIKMANPQLKEFIIRVSVNTVNRPAADELGDRLRGKGIVVNPLTTDIIELDAKRDENWGK